MAEDLAACLTELIGNDVVCGDDGFRMWFPCPGKGGWTSWSLRVIADWMDALDEPHARAIDAYFEKEGQ